MPTSNKQTDVSYTVNVSGFSNASYTTVVAARIKSRVWVTTPGFHTKRKLRAELPVNPLDEQTVERVDSLSSVELHKWVGGANPVVKNTITFYGGHYWLPQQTLPTPGNNALYNKCLTKFPTKVNGESFNSLVFLAEFKKTRAMVLTLAQDIAMQFSKMQKSRVKDLSSISGRAYRDKHGFSKHKFRSDSGLTQDSGLSKREIQNVWLEYRYGWRLLVKDIQDALKSLHDTRTRRPVLRVTASSREEVTQSFTLNHLQLVNRIAPPGQVLNDLTCIRKYCEETKVTVRFRDSLPLLGTLQQYGITNPALLVWELIPYSFVFDWLVPVGDYLSTIDTFVGKEFVSGCASYITDDSVISKPTNVRGDPTNFGWVLGKVNHLAESTAKRRFYRRVALTSFPSATLPRLDVNLNTQRVIDAISLVTQKIRR